MGCNLRTVKAAAFANCLGLRELRLPHGLRVIADGAYPLGAFGGCTALASVIIPSTVQRIGNCAFSQTPSLQTVLFGRDSQLFHVGRGCFFNSGLRWIALPASVSEIGRSAFAYCGSLARVWSAGGAPAGAGEVRWPPRMTAIAWGAFQNCRAIVLLVLPPVLEQIEASAFAGATSLENVSFAADSRLSQIGAAAFAYSGLTSVGIPASVRDVEEWAFAGCQRLTSVTFAEGSNLAWVGKCAFAECASLRVLQFAEGSDPEFEGDNALMGCTALQVLRVPRAAAAQFADSVPAACAVELTS